MILTDRDRRLLLEIQDYGLLPTKRIASRHFDNSALTTVLRRLRKLEQARYIKRIDGLKNGSHAWCLTTVASQLLNDKPAKFSYPRQILDHDIALMELRMRLEEMNVSLAWKAEHVIRTKMAQSQTYRDLHKMNVPDGLMGVSVDHGHQHAVAIELEMTAKNQFRYRDILEEYGRRRDLWAVWYVVRKPTIGRQLMKAYNCNYKVCAPRIFWSVLDEVMADPLSACVRGEHFESTVKGTFLPKEAAHGELIF